MTLYAILLGLTLAQVATGWVVNRGIYHGPPPADHAKKIDDTHWTLTTLAHDKALLRWFAGYRNSWTAECTFAPTRNSSDVRSFTMSREGLTRPLLTGRQFPKRITACATMMNSPFAGLCFKSARRVDSGTYACAVKTDLTHYDAIQWDLKVV